MKTQNTIKTITIALLFVVFFSCSDNDKPCCANNIDNNATISYIDGVGNDLLNPASEGSYKEENIDIYRLNSEGIKVQVYYENYNHPEAFHIYYSSGFEKNVMEVYFYPEGEFSPELVTYFIDFGNGEEDKVEAEIEEYSNGERLLKVWYNDVLVWERDVNNDNNYFEIVK